MKSRSGQEVCGQEGESLQPLENYRLAYEAGGRAEQTWSLAGKFVSVKITTLGKAVIRERSRECGCRRHGSMVSSAAEQGCDSARV